MLSRQVQLSDAVVAQTIGYDARAERRGGNKEIKLLCYHKWTGEAYSRKARFALLIIKESFGSSCAGRLNTRLS